MSVLNLDYKIASSNTSRLEAHVGLFRFLMKGILDAYVLSPFDIFFELVTLVNTRDFTVFILRVARDMACLGMGFTGVACLTYCNMTCVNVVQAYMWHDRRATSLQSWRIQSEHGLVKHFSD